MYAKVYDSKRIYRINKNLGGLKQNENYFFI